MEFKETKKIAVALLQYCNRKDAIQLCNQLKNYIARKGHTTEYACTINLKDSYVLTLMDDVINAEHQKAIRVIKETATDPVLILVGLPLVIIQRLLIDMENYLNSHSEEEIQALTGNSTELSFYSIATDVGQLIDHNNKAQHRVLQPTYTNNPSSDNMG